MGFNIAGLVINNNYDHDLKAFSDDLNLNLTVKEEIFF